jgi:hypothetical protein
MRGIPVNMTKIKELIYKERLQYLVYVGLSIAVMGLTGIGYFSDNLLFQRFLGRINPLIAILFIIFLGVVLLFVLLSQGWFAIYGKENLKGLLLGSGLATLFGLIAILVDYLMVVFPADLNILFPESLLFYPVMGFIVEILFHVLPITLILIIPTLFSEKITNKIIWVIIFAVSLFEPIFQTILGFSGQYPLWTVVYVGLHVFLINLSQLMIFKRYDFISMYSFRLVYYILWHIVWGYMRLKLLF